jgi:hypothetical protein
VRTLKVVLTEKKVEDSSSSEIPTRRNRKIRCLTIKLKTAKEVARLDNDRKTQPTITELNRFDKELKDPTKPLT